MGYIYKITNTINGKAYVGQTYRTVQERFVEHLRMARKTRIRYKSLLYNAIKKYGENAREVHQYTIDGKYIRSYVSVSEASRCVGGRGCRTIVVACSNAKHTGYGYRWSFEKQNILQVS